MERKAVKTVTVIGGANTDIGASSKKKLVMRDSNIGSVTVSFGGVGRNIAENLVNLGVKVRFITALGDDSFGKSLLADCREKGMDMSCTLICPEERSSVYIYVCDSDGDMLMAVNDMDIVLRITPEYLADHMDEINSSDAVVIDGNLSRESIEYICNNSAAPVYADTVSEAKAERFSSVPDKLRGIKPNIMEARLLTGMTDAESCARELTARGVGRTFISEGLEGITAAEAGKLVHRDAVRAHCVNATGAGDAVTAAAVWADINGLSLEKSVELAVMAGALAVESEKTVSPELIRITQI